MPKGCTCSILSFTDQYYLLWYSYTQESLCIAAVGVVHSILGVQGHASHEFQSPLLDYLVMLLEFTSRTTYTPTLCSDQPTLTTCHFLTKYW